MKIKNGFVLRRFANQWLAVSADDMADTRNTLVTLNKTAAFVWELLQTDTDRQAVIAALTERFDVTEAVAAADVDAFLDKVRQAGVLDE